MLKAKKQIEQNLLDMHKALINARTQIDKIKDPHLKALKQDNIAQNEFQYNQLLMIKDQIFSE